MDTTTALPRAITGLSEIAGTYRALLCDVWGVIHNGVAAHAEAVEALKAFRARGGNVLLISNAPRPGDAVERQLTGLGVDLACRDGVITSGDVAKATLAEKPGARVFHMGPDWDHFVYEGLNITLTDLANADIVSCVGFVDDTTETVADYEELLRGAVARKLPMLCANPDLVVERGNQLVPCAGALAARYRELGGEANVVGKPHAPIYNQALAAIDRIAGKPVARSAVLAIGDGIGTDVIGANSAGLDVLFITGGVHAADAATGGDGANAIADLLDSGSARAAAWMPRLIW